MATSAPLVTPPAKFPARLAWLQREIQHRVRPYHVAVGAILGLITAVFTVIIVLMLLTATNFNLLGWME
jgi:cobalamin biosynthesis protein CobD/CbiB